MTAQTAEVVEEVVLEDLSVILPPGTPMVIDGIEVTIRPLKTREFMMAMGVVTDGLGPNLAMLDLSGEPEQVQATMLAAFMMAIPNATPRFMQLIGSIVDPIDPKRKGELRGVLDNPDLDDMMRIIDVVIDQEAENLQALLGKGRAYMKRWQETFRKFKGHSRESST